MLVDAHCHLDHLADAAAVLARAREAGVVQMVVNGLWQADGGFGDALTLAEAHPQVAFPTVGIHPHECAQAPREAYEQCARLAEDPRIVAVGETGLDYHYDHSPRGRQRESLRWTIALARRVGKPLVIHVREADDDLARILKEERAGEIGGQIHCFSGGPEEAKTYLDLGFFISFSGIVTFKGAQSVREAARYTPLDRMLVETDSPYLAPLPYRGRRNEPAYVVETARALAGVLGVRFEALAQQTTENARRLFRLPGETR